MLENEKYQLNLAVNEFVSSFPGDEFTEEQVIVAFRNAHGDLIASAGITPGQVERMIRYVLEVGCSEDAFAVAEADLERIPSEVLNHFVPPHVRDFWQQADDKVWRAFELRNAERRRMDRRIGYIEEFIWDFSEEGALTWPKSIGCGYFRTTLQWPG
jgi:hypothetical protein